MPIKLEELPEYQTARDEYTGAISAAKAAQDETAELRAEIRWRDVKDDLRTKVDTQNSKEREIAAALEKAKTDFPNVPEKVYAKLSDPEEILAVAEEFAASIDEAVKKAQPSRPRSTDAAPRAAGNGQSWPQTPTGGQPPSPNRDPYNDDAYLTDLNRRFARKGTRDRNEAAAEVADVIFERQVMPNFQRAIDRGRRSEP